jgi:phosphoribosyl-ATP pyrophosphohydrolase
VNTSSQIGLVLSGLAETISARAEAGKEDSSYTANLLAKGLNKIAKKLIEEAGELGLALASETETDVANEAADVLYHMLVGLQARGVSLDDVATVLASREGLSGLAEKAGR